MATYVVFDVEIRDAVRYQDFMRQVKPALDAAGARYLARGGALAVWEGDWQPRRIVADRLQSLVVECSTARLVSVEGVAP